MQQEVSINKLAYRKAIFHCLKYPSLNVVGIFTGTVKQIKDAYPLFHTPLVSPTLEIAFELVQSQLSSGESIVGVYTSAVNCQEAVGQAGSKLIEAIQKSVGGQPIHMNIYIDNKQSQPTLNYSVTSGTSRQKTSTTLHNFQQGNHRQLVDMDSHLQNIELDFTNSYVK